MRRGRGFLILVVVALGLGAYIFFVESKRDPSETAATAKKDKVFATDSSKFEEIELKAASGETTTLKKVNGLWEIVKPEPLPTDSAEVGSLLNTLDTLEVQRVVVENPSSAAEYGLDPARIAVSFKVTGEIAPKKLLVGNKTPTGGDLYARVEGQPRVFLISAFQEDSLNKTPFGLRDKTALKFERDAADSIAIDVPGSPAVAFAKKGTEWRFTKPWDAKADFGTVDGLVGKLFMAKMASIEAADGTADLKKFGLDKPQATVTLGAGSTQARLALGAKKEDGNVYARDLSRPMVFTIDATLLDDLKKKPEDLRKKEVFEFRAFSATSVSVTVGGKSLTFDKQKAPAPKDASTPPGPDVWKQTKPDAKDADQAKLTDMLTTLSNLRAEKFAEKPFGAGEDLVVTVKFGDDPASQTTEEVRFRKSGGVVHAILPGEGGALVVSTAEFDKTLAIAKELAGIK
jgi:hypothetical protein